MKHAIAIGVLEREIAVCESNMRVHGDCRTGKSGMLAEPEPGYRERVAAKAAGLLSSVRELKWIGGA